MAYIITPILILLNSIYSLTKRNSKFISVLLIIFMWILFWGNYYNHDYEVYFNLYNTNGIYAETIEFGFIFLINLGNLLNMNYHTFLSTIYIGCLILIHTTVKKYTSNFNLVYLFYFFTPFLVDIIQIRNFIAMSLVIYSINFLFEEKNTLFLVLILFAATFHRQALVYLTLVLINLFKRNKNIINYMILLSISFSIIMLFNNKDIPFWEEISGLFNLEKVNIYMDSQVNLGFIIYWGRQLISNIVIYISLKLNSPLKTQDGNFKSVQTKFTYLIYWVNKILLLFLPLYLIDSNFYRISRNTLILNYIVFAITLKNIRKKSNKIIYLLIIVLYVAILSYMTIYMRNIQQPIFDYNMFL